MRLAAKVPASNTPALIDIDASNFHVLPCCGIKSESHPGRKEKCAWLQSNARFGLRARALLAPDGKPCGYIEYLPGEHAWRGVDARGYMFVHCIWIHSRQHQGRGWGQFMIDACVEDAKTAGMSGVAVVTRSGPWLAGRRLFVVAGFEPVDSAPPDYELLVRKFNAAAANPAFKKDWRGQAARYGKGLTIIRSGQCPYTAKFAAEIAATAKEEYGLKPRIVELKSWQEAQDAPTPYATFAVIYNGRLIADHQVSRTRFRNIMAKLQA